MFDRILIPTDGSGRADAALEVGRRVAERDHGTLVLLRVENEGEERDVVLAAKAAMEQQARALRSLGTAAECRLEYGRPEEGIAAVAMEEGVALVVMSHRHRGTLAALRYPSVTAREFSRSPAPILVWPEGMLPRAYDELLTLPNAAVIVPLDGSEEAERALQLAGQLAGRYGRSLLLLRVVAPMPFSHLSGVYLDARGTPTDDEAEAQAYLKETRTRLARETRLTVESMLLAGDAAGEITRIASAHEGSLIVMTTHGRTGLAKLLLGSVAATLMERTETPLLVVPPVQYATASAQEHAKEPDAALAGQWAPMF